MEEIIKAGTKSIRFDSLLVNGNNVGKIQRRWEVANGEGQAEESRQRTSKSSRAGFENMEINANRR